MFAVIKTGGKQYRVAANDVITIATVQAEPGGEVVFDEVLLVGSDSGTEVGTPHVAGASVAGELVAHTRGEKVIAFKKRRRQNSRRKRGYRDELTVVRITAIGGSSEKPKARRARTAAEAAPSPEAVASGESEPALAGEVTVE